MCVNVKKYGLKLARAAHNSTIASEALFDHDLLAMAKGQEKGREDAEREADEIKEANAYKYGTKGGQSSDDEPGTGQAYHCPVKKMVGMFVQHIWSEKRGQILEIGDYRWWGCHPERFKIRIWFPEELPGERDLEGMEEVVHWRWHYMYKYSYWTW